jgi:putative tryptophan/tyrosine transport system substrate-binding protein
MKILIRALFLVLSAAALAAHAQPAKKHRVGLLIPATTPDVNQFLRGLRDLGYVDGENLALDVRVAGDRLDKLRAMAGEIVQASPDVILAVNTPGVQAAMAATTTIPIVMVAVGDPVGTKFVTSFARPDKNVTGLTNLCGELAGKRLALFKEALRATRRIAIMLNSADPITQPQVRDIERTAPALGIEARFFPVRTYADVESTVPEMLKWRPDGVLWLCGQHRELTRQMLPLATARRVPVMVAQPVELPSGGLISYATDNADLFRRAAVYVDKLLKGAKVGDLPVEQPTKFELVINMKAAATLGLTLPQSVLVRADRLIK